MSHLTLHIHFFKIQRAMVVADFIVGILNALLGRNIVTKFSTAKPEVTKKTVYHRHALIGGMLDTQIA